MRFSKYHGTGNDFVMLADPLDEVVLAPELVRRLCDRRFGIGADGVIRAAPGRDGADLFMDYVNSDGSIGEMCGNGIRCLALFARAQGLAHGDDLRVATRAGVKLVEVLEDGRVRVDMGPPVFAPSAVPVRWDGTDALGAKLELDNEVIEAACLSMGNPHAVVLVEDPADAPVATLGPAIERHRAFPNHTNVEFVRVDSARRLTMRVWERGAGETLACGTGACAAAVVARLLAGAGDTVVVALPGGELEVSWTGSLAEEAPVLLTGPAVESFTGEVDVEAPR
ncbi:diaminopimelate epimerase [soil metagenome]